MVVAVFFKVFGAICAAERRAYNALCDVIDLVSAVSRGKITPQQLQSAVEFFLDAYITAFGEDHMTPKFHGLFTSKYELSGDIRSGVYSDDIVILLVMWY